MIMYWYVDMKKVAFLIGVCLLGSLSMAQQQAQYSQYMLNEYLINPAVSGVEDFIDVKMGYRSQWVGISDHPNTFYFSAHGDVGKTHAPRTHKGDYHNWHGLGVLVSSDQTGPTKQNSGYLNYAYNIKLTDGSGFNRFHKDGIRLSVGTFVGLNQYSIDRSKLTFDDENDDALTNVGISTKTLPDASIGGMLYFQDKYFIGFSAFQLFGNKIAFQGLGSTVNSDITEESKLFRHYYLSMAYKKKIEEGFYIIPSALLKFVHPAPLSVDLNLWLDYKDQFYGGISYRAGDAIAVMAGVLIHKQIEMYYSYDLTVSDLSVHSNGAHEVTVGYRFLWNSSARNPF